MSLMRVMMSRKMEEESGAEDLFEEKKESPLDKNGAPLVEMSCVDLDKLEEEE